MNIWVCARGSIKLLKPVPDPVGQGPPLSPVQAVYTCPPTHWGGLGLGLSPSGQQMAAEIAQLLPYTGPPRFESHLCYPLDA